MRERVELTAEQQRELHQIDERIAINKQEVGELYEEYSFFEELGPTESRSAEKWYNHHPKVQEQERLYKHRKLLQPYSLTDALRYGQWHRVPFLVFVDGCLAGDFTDNNIVAYYATSDKTSDIRLLPSDILERLYRDDFQYVVYRKRL